MLPAVFHQEAIQELEEAVVWYAERSPRVAARFQEAIEAGVRSAQEHPERHAFLRQTGKRAVRLDRYPYLIVYEQHPGHIWINAIAHEKRHPDYWLGREL
ncbi:type II toxin-antitoxin system RelE/ParE family toxin [Brevifollis gellanilyticus]|uniref:Plasmid stabilization protein n=1 Tax=Brevifollis gellanilyticus TaxID=748831 RepID=A0A512MCU3_9BACT|nr:type II toxin-antitoxin system RelE/ParE family toxin [Brevifollis gellanilyticus]GEP44555.1 plasmid stabilization protein [Brevifollis gellanilyticus]